MCDSKNIESDKLKEVTGGTSYTDKYCGICGDWLVPKKVEVNGEMQERMVCCACGWIRPY